MILNNYFIDLITTNRIGESIVMAFNTVLVCLVVVVVVAIIVTASSWMISGTAAFAFLLLVVVVILVTATVICFFVIASAANSGAAATATAAAAADADVMNIGAFRWWRGDLVHGCCCCCCDHGWFRWSCDTSGTLRNTIIVADHFQDRRKSR